VYYFFGRFDTVMTTPANPTLEPGRVYRTRDFAAWAANAPRLARRLLAKGELVRLGHGLFAYAKRGRFGTVLPADEEILRAFLDGGAFVLTGPERWNALGLGSTALFAAPLVYNTKRSGTFELGGRRFMLRRVAFPAQPPAEWYVVDFMENAEQAGVSTSDLTTTLRRALAAGRFDPGRLREMVSRYGKKSTQTSVASALAATPP